MAHQVLQCLWIHAGAGHVAAVGMAADISTLKRRTAKNAGRRLRCSAGSRAVEAEVVFRYVHDAVGLRNGGIKVAV